MDEAKLTKIVRALEKQIQDYGVVIDRKFGDMVKGLIEGKSGGLYDRIRELLNYTPKVEEKPKVKRKIRPPPVDIAEYIANILGSLIGGTPNMNKPGEWGIYFRIPKSQYDSYISKVKSKQSLFTDEFVNLLEEFRVWLDDYNKRHGKKRQTISVFVKVTPDKTTVTAAWADVVKGSKKAHYFTDDRFNEVDMTEYL